jgi:CheY-like chemotaxis protein
MRAIRKILIVDDDEITCFLNKVCLEDIDIAEEIDYVHDGLQALKYIKENCSIETIQRTDCPDLIFLDINMPMMNGFEFLEEFKRLDNSSLNRIYIVLLTSSVSPKDIQEAAKHANNLKGYITKPLTEESVKKVMAEIKKAA